MEWAGWFLGRPAEVGGGLDQRVDDPPRERVTVAGRKQRVDVTPPDRVREGTDRDAAVLAADQARDPADAEPAGDHAAGGERLAWRLDDVGVGSRGGGR